MVNTSPTSKPTNSLLDSFTGNVIPYPDIFEIDKNSLKSTFLLMDTVYLNPILQPLVNYPKEILELHEAGLIQVIPKKELSLILESIEEYAIAYRDAGGEVQPKNLPGDYLSVSEVTALAFLTDNAWDNCITGMKSFCPNTLKQLFALFVETGFSKEVYFKKPKTDSAAMKGARAFDSKGEKALLDILSFLALGIKLCQLKFGAVPIPLNPIWNPIAFPYQHSTFATKETDMRFPSVDLTIPFPSTENLASVSFSKLIKFHKSTDEQRRAFRNAISIYLGELNSIDNYHEYGIAANDLNSRLMSEYSDFLKLLDEFKIQKINSFVKLASPTMISAGFSALGGLTGTLIGDPVIASATGASVGYAIDLTLNKIAWYSASIAKHRELCQKQPISYLYYLNKAFPKK